MKYIVKKTATATKGNELFYGEANTYYIGKDGYIHLCIYEEGLDPWVRKAYAEKYIADDRAFMDDRGMDKYWDYEYEILVLN